VAVEKLLSRDFTNEIRPQVIESSFAVGAEIHRNYWFGSFFNSHGILRQRSFSDAANFTAFIDLPVLET
jgi:hypothetical protein